MIHRRIRGMNPIVVAVFAIFWAPGLARSQPMGELSGVISDQTGAPLPAVRMTIQGPAGRETLTNASGEYAFQGLPEGSYQISAELRGFERARRAVLLHAGERVTLSFALRVVMKEEPIVTAARVGEREVQTLPMAISAVTNSELARLVSRTVAEGAALAPSVTFSENTGFGQLTIRGIGANAVFAGSDPSSAMYLDGVSRAAGDGLRAVSQSGSHRSASWPARNLIWTQRRRRGNKPDIEAADQRVSGVRRSHGRKLRDASCRCAGQRSAETRQIDGGLLHSRAASATATYVISNIRAIGSAVMTLQRQGQLRLIFDRRTNLLVSSDVDYQGGDPLTYNKVLAVKPGYQIDVPSDFHEVRSSVLAWNKTMHYGSSARLTMSLTPATTLVSLTAFRKLDREFLVDSDVTELEVVRTHQVEGQHQFSEEITISHQTPALTWVAGVFLFDEFDQQSLWSDLSEAGLQSRLDPRVDATSRAVFGQATVELTPRLSAAAGIRYTHEGKDIVNAGGRYRLDTLEMAAPDSVYEYSDSISHTAWTPRLGLEMKLADGALTYVSATRGFKSGGFNLSSPAAGRGFAPEWTWSYEAGWKGTLAGGRSRFDVSAFVMDYTNLQVQTPIGIGILDIRNAAAATILGIEVEDTSRVARGVEAGGHLTWLDATYDQYIAVAISGDTGDVAGNRLNNAPEWAGRLWIECAIDGVLHAVQRHHPAPGSIWHSGRPCRIRPKRSPVGCQRVLAKPHGHQLRHGNFRDASDGVWGTSRPLASIRHRVHRKAVRPAFSLRSRR